MVSRRVFLASSYTAIGCFCGGARKKRHSNRTGCLGLSASAGGSFLDSSFATSGESVIDEFCASEHQSLQNLFSLNCALSYYDDSDAPNAVALSSSRDPARPDGTIVIGVSLARMLIARRTDMLELACVMAHEVGHIMQYKKNFLSSWVIKNELSADYLAGWYIAKTRRLNRQSVENLSGWFKEIGDIAFTEEDHHGTPWQRSKIFMRGAGIVGDEFSEGEGRDVLSPDDSISEAFTNALSITGADGG